MIVTLDIFSGRPNPTWTLPDDQTRKQLVDRVAGKALPAASAGGGNLGFRGFVIEASGDDVAATAGVPDAFRLGGLHPAELTAPHGLAASALRPEESNEAALWLLSTARGHVEDEVLRHVESAIKEPAPHQEAPAVKEGKAPAAGEETVEDKAAAAEAVKAGIALSACIIANTPYNPGFWNVPTVQPYNNCYNYSMNYKSNTFAQPGTISGHPNNVMQCANVATAANWDGCRAYCSGSNKNVALVIWPGVDYHWYRKHSNGFWGHKPGSTAARNTDNSGHVIGGALTPANCNRGPYTIFCGYRFSPTGMHVK